MHVTTHKMYDIEISQKKEKDKTCIVFPSSFLSIFNPLCTEKIGWMHIKDIRIYDAYMRTVIIRRNSLAKKCEGLYKKISYIPCVESICFPEYK
jgi:hypothetical protein